ncbi:hypothetical protein [Allosalinactinospora lopnorensis]|uniref:hypothetical protein n=1 Tax=Allosalinactinospora lopnorensis TaxID=1352348 RepID=UPI001567C9F9|nr:hypothetical protein [Allosalinactinospora lopnorensis]
MLLYELVRLQERVDEKRDRERDRLAARRRRAELRERDRAERLLLEPRCARLC